MKLTKTRLRHIIKEEISALFEVAEKEHEKDVPIDIAKKESEDGVFVDLASLVNLAIAGEGTAQINGIDMSAGKRPQPMTLVASITEDPSKGSLPVAPGEDLDKVFVPKKLFGESFNVAHPQYGKYNFIVQV